METILQQLLLGLTNGMVFALIALGYTMVYGILELINFAHGDLFMLASFLALTLVGALGLQTASGAELVFGLLLVIAVCALFAAGLNWSVDRVVYKPLRKAPKLAPLVSAIGVSFIFMNIGLFWGGLPMDVFGGGVAAAAPKSFPELLPNENVLLDLKASGLFVLVVLLVLGLATLILRTFPTGRWLVRCVVLPRSSFRQLAAERRADAAGRRTLGLVVGAFFWLHLAAALLVGATGLLGGEPLLSADSALRATPKDLLVIGSSLVVMLALFFFVGGTKLGKAMRATAQNPTAARLMGIDVDRVIGATFLIGGALAGFAAVIYSLYINTINFQMGYQNGLYAFTAAVLGGIGNIPGAVLGGIVIGIVRAFSDQYLGAQWQPAVLFGMLILILVFRPSGLLGSTAREKV